MKPKNLYQWLIVIFSVVILVGCGKNNHPNRSPSPPPSRYPDRPVVVIFGDGSKNSPGNLPPGQAKKIYGHKSAKAFAPGQQKKYRDRYGRVPPIVISIPDSRGKRDGSGKWYYQDEDSFIYWKNSDGYYHIDDKYFNEDGDTREAKKSEDYDERTNGNGKGNGNGNGKAKGKGKN
jgi:hypothetical protein